MLLLVSSFFVLILLSSELSSNALEIQEVPFSSVRADNRPKVSHISKTKQNQTRYFDWQKKDKNAEYIPDEPEEEFDVETVYEMTEAPIINVVPNAKQIIEKIPENIPEMALSKFKAPEQVGDVASILWGATVTESTTISSKLNHQQTELTPKLNEPSLDSDVEVFSGHFPSTTMITTSSTLSLEKNLQLELEVERIDINSHTPSTGRSLETTTLTKLQSTTKFPLITKMTKSTTTVLPSNSEAPFYSAEETTPFSEARYLLGAPAKILQSSTLPSASSTTIASHQSSMDRIMAAMPSIDEDMIRTYTLKNKERYGHGHAKPRTITHELETKNFTKFNENHSDPIDYFKLGHASQIENTTSSLKMRREMTISMVAGKK